MKRTIIFLIGALMTVGAFANVNHITISKISNEDKFITAFNYIKDNQAYYDHWTDEWNYDQPKEEVIKKLRDNFSIFSSIKTKNEELFLLLGDISHYLYNLDDTAYYKLAINNYDSAIQYNPQDYRAYWFLAFHYAQANVPNSAFDNFIKAQAILPSERPSDFWEDYAWATAVAGIPSHSIFAMDKARSILGTQGKVERQLGQNIRNRIVNLNNDSTYKKENIWSAIKGDKITFVCRPLGIKFLVDPSWTLSINDYINHQFFCTMEPPTLKNKNGREIHYTLALLIKTVNDNDKLEDFLNKFLDQYPEKSKIPFSDRYDKMSAFEIHDHTMYQNLGGGHLYMIGVERKMPEYHGLLLENPMSLPDGGKTEVTYYTVSDSKNRFKGRLFYLIMLDTCEDIHEQSFLVFKNFFDNQIIIE